MSSDDQQRWDERYRLSDRASGGEMPVGLTSFESLLPTSGRALDVACGAGRGSVWLAARGLDVLGVDVSPVAIARAEQLAVETDLGGRCRFVTHDFDTGLPDGAAVDLVVCHLFNATALDDALVDRLAPGGILAVTVLSVVEAEPGPFRAEPGELLHRFGRSEVLGHEEREGRATIVVRAAGPTSHGRLD